MTDLVISQNTVQSVEIDQDFISVIITPNLVPELVVTQEIHPDVVVISEEAKVVTVVSPAPQGVAGRGIESFLRVSGDGSPGTDDVYRLTYTDETFEEFTIHQGQDGTTGSSLTEHLEDTTPHPPYDDMPSLTLLYDNGLI